MVVSLVAYSIVNFISCSSYPLLVRVSELVMEMGISTEEVGIGAGEKGWLGAEGDRHGQKGL